jgi:hypothetical protein
MDVTSMGTSKKLTLYRSMLPPEITPVRESQAFGSMGILLVCPQAIVTETVKHAAVNSTSPLFFTR